MNRLVVLFLLLVCELSGQKNVQVSEVKSSGNALKSWAPSAIYVKAYLFNCEREPYRPLFKDGELHPGVIKQFTKTLSEEQYRKLEDSFSTSGGIFFTKDAFEIYRPRYAFVFFDADDRPIAQFDFDSTQTTIRANPKLEFPKYQRIRGLSELVKDLGFPVFRKDDEWNAYFGNKK